MKRRLRVRPEFFAQPTPVDNTTAKAIGKALYPTKEEFSKMITTLLARKVWSPHFYAQLLNIPLKDLKRIIAQTLEPSGALARLIWTYYIYDTAPNHLANPTFIMSWGRSSIALPKDRTNEREVIKQVMSTKTRLDVNTIKKLCNNEGVVTDSKTVQNVARFLNYKLGKAKREQRILKADSVWMNCDWSESNKQIAARYGMCESVVSLNRNKLRRFKRAELLEAFRGAGRTEKDVEALLYCRVKVLRASRKAEPVAVPATEHPVPSPQNISVPGNTSESQTDVCESNADPRP